MEKFTIAAASWQSGFDLSVLLSRFQTELLETEDGRQQVVVTPKDDREIIEVLNAIEDYVTRRNRGPAQIEWHEHTYALHPREQHPPGL